MQAKYWVLLIVIAYIALWLLTARALNRDEKDEKMQSLWFMVSMAWPFVWICETVLFFKDLFKKDCRRY